MVMKMSELFEGDIKFKLYLHVHRDRDGKPHVVHDLFIADDINLAEISMAFYQLYILLLRLIVESENFPPDFEYTEFKEEDDGYE